MRWVRAHPTLAGILLGGVAVGIALFVLAVVLNFISVAQVNQCIEVKNVFSSFLTEQAGRIGKPGTATYHYYQQHPNMLDEARQVYDQYIHDFNNINC